MALDKETLNNFLPNGFETENKDGYKTNFSDDKIATGYQKDVFDIVSGPNLNNFIDKTGKNFNVLNDYVNYLNNIPINSIPIINENNKLDYVNKSDLRQNGQPIGTIFSVSCTSSYVPVGALPCDGTQYAKIQFNAFYENYLVGGLLNTCTFEEYNNDIATYGQCGRFAIDTTNNIFRVPNIKDGVYLTQALSDNELGKVYNESLPNIKGFINELCTYSSSAPTGAFYQSSSGTWKKSGTDQTLWQKDLNLDASRSSSTYQDNAKVQGDNVRMRFFVQVANGTINDEEMDWSAWASGLAGKLNTSGATTATTVDGQWVINPIAINESTAIGTYTVDLSDYLPDDGYTYELIGRSHLDRAANSGGGTNTVLNVYNSDQTLQWAHLEADYTNWQQNDTSFVCVVGTERSLVVAITAYAANSHDTNILAYRRIGTNS